MRIKNILCSVVNQYFVVYVKLMCLKIMFFELIDKAIFTPLKLPESI